MAGLSGLKLVAAQGTVAVPVVQQRRNNLCKRLLEQMELAKSHAGLVEFAPKRVRTVRDEQTGAKRQVEAPKRVKPWWATAENGKLLITVRYGARILELAKGKFAVEVGSERELVPVLEAIKSAVLAGELDDAMAASAKRGPAGS